MSLLKVKSSVVGPSRGFSAELSVAETVGVKDLHLSFVLAVNFQN